jgi:hypothetical protein
VALGIGPLEAAVKVADAAQHSLATKRLLPRQSRGPGLLDRCYLTGDDVDEFPPEPHGVCSVGDRLLAMLLRSAL